MESASVYGPMRSKLSFSAVLKRTFSTPFKAPVVFFVLTLIGIAPSILIGLLVGSSTFKALATLLLVCSMISDVWALGAICHAACRVLDGAPVSIGQSLRETFPRLPALIVIVILSSVFLWTGFYLLIIPGLIIASMIICTVPACVCEHKGPFVSFGRSAELTKGNRWPIIFIWLLIILSFLIFSGPLIGAIWPEIDPFIRELYFGNRGINLVIIGNIMTALGTVMFSSLASVIYHDLFAIKQGTI